MLGVAVGDPAPFCAPGLAGGCQPPTTTKHRNCSLPKTQPVCLNIQGFPFTVIVWGGYLSMGAL